MRGLGYALFCSESPHLITSSASPSFPRHSKRVHWPDADTFLKAWEGLDAEGRDRLLEKQENFRVELEKVRLGFPRNPLVIADAPQFSSDCKRWVWTTREAQYKDQKKLREVRVARYVMISLSRHQKSNQTC